MTLLPESEMMKVVKKGIVLPFLLLLASVALIIGAFFILNNKQKVTPQNQTTSPSPSPANETVYTEASRSGYTDEGSANWKIYEDSKFSIKYPPNWLVYDSVADPLPNRYRLFFKSSDYADDGGMPSITEGFRVSLVFPGHQCLPPYSSPGTFTKEEINLNGRKVYLVESNADILSYRLATQDICLRIDTPSEETLLKNKNDFLNSITSFQSK